MLVYTRDDDGNGISATREFEPETSVDSKPELAFSKETASPGESVSVTVKGGSSGAVCGYSVVDKSVDLVANRNSVNHKNIRRLKGLLAKRRVVQDETRGEGCRNANLLFKVND